MTTTFGSSTSINSAKFIPYLYNRIRTLILTLVNSQIIADRETVQISTDSDGNNEDFTNSSVNFQVFHGGSATTGSWTISVDSETNCTTNQVSNDITITAITADEASYIVKAERTGYTTLTKKIQVSKVKDGGNLPSAGTTGQALTKASSTDYDVQWENIAVGTYQNSSNEHLIPTSEVGEGNPRGNNAIDFQMIRSADTQVASANYTFIGSGINNTNSGEGSFLGAGSGNTISPATTYGFLGAGINNTVAGPASAIITGNNNTTSGSYSTIVAGTSNTVSGDSTLSAGISNTAHDYAETVVGVFATESTGSQISNSAGNIVFKVGSGTGTSSRSDGLSVSNEGITTINNILDITPQASAPTAVEGRVYYNSSDNTLYCYDGTTWQALY